MLLFSMLYGDAIFWNNFAAGVIIAIAGILIYDMETDPEKYYSGCDSGY